MRVVWVLEAYEDEAVGHLEGLEDGGFEAAGVVFGRSGSPGPRIRTLRQAQGRLWGTQIFATTCGQRLEVMRSTTASMVWFFALFEAHALGELGHLAVDPGAKALLVKGFELFAELSLAPADDGGVDGDAFRRGRGRRFVRRSARRTGGVMGRPQLGQCGWPTEA